MLIIDFKIRRGYELSENVTKIISSHAMGCGSGGCGGVAVYGGKDNNKNNNNGCGGGGGC